MMKPLTDFANGTYSDIPNIKRQLTSAGEWSEKGAGAILLGLFGEASTEFLDREGSNV